MNLQTFLNNGVDYQHSSVQADAELVQDIQRHLIRLGFDPGLADGLWGRKTQAAFDRFCTANSIVSNDFTIRIARSLLQSVPKLEPVAVTGSGAIASGAQSPSIGTSSSQQPVVSAPTPSVVAAGVKQRINAEGLKLIKDFEGLKLEAYICPAGVPTIGYGSTSGVKLGQRISLAEAEALLLKDLERFEAAIHRAVIVPLTDNQFSALVSFTFNVGTGAFKDSTLLRLLNQGDYQGAADQLLRWDKAGGKSLAGLQRRRQAERALFLKK